MDATTFGDVFYAASLTSPDHTTELLELEDGGKTDLYFQVTFPPDHSEWFTYLRLNGIIYRGDGCYRLTVSSARYGIPAHLSSSFIASVGFILRRRHEVGQDQPTTDSMYGSP